MSKKIESILKKYWKRYLQTDKFEVSKCRDEIVELKNENELATR